MVEIAGAVENPGVYKFEIGARVEDILIAADGVLVDGDRSWMEKFLIAQPDFLTDIKYILQGLTSPSVLLRASS